MNRSLRLTIVSEPSLSTIPKCPPHIDSDKNGAIGSKTASPFNQGYANDDVLGITVTGGAQGNMDAR